MIDLYLLLGGNLGDKKATFLQATKRLEQELGKLVMHSGIYETEPWGFDCKDYFWNQVLVLKTDLSPQEVLKSTKSIELELGRVRGEERYASRTIDIDMLFYGNLQLNEDNLQLPHPRMVNRNFVLKPLSEVAPKFIHPVFNKDISQLLAECDDKLQVSVVE